MALPESDESESSMSSVHVTGQPHVNVVKVGGGVGGGTGAGVGGLSGANVGVGNDGTSQVSGSQPFPHVSGNCDPTEAQACLSE